MVSVILEVNDLEHRKFMNEMMMKRNEIYKKRQEKERKRKQMEKKRMDKLRIEEEAKLKSERDDITLNKKNRKLSLPETAAEKARKLRGKLGKVMCYIVVFCMYLYL